MFYFSPKYLNICYAGERKKERGIAKVRTVQLGAAPGAASLYWGMLVTGRCLLHPHFVEPKLMFFVFQAGQPDQHPEWRCFGGLQEQNCWGIRCVNRM